MKTHHFSVRSTLLATGIAVALGLSQTALADTASDDLEITAGLTEALTLSCETALSFGITRLETGNRGGTTTLTVDPDGGDITLGGDDTNVSAGTGQAGTCTIAGSSATDGATVTVTIGGSSLESADVSLVADANAFSGLGPPGTLLNDLDVSTFATNPGSVVIDSNGGATFNIGGTLTIPAEVTGDNLGGYSNEVTVEVDDGFTG